MCSTFYYKKKILVRLVVISYTSEINISWKNPWRGKKIKNIEYRLVLKINLFGDPGKISTLTLIIKVTSLKYILDLWKKTLF